MVKKVDGNQREIVEGLRKLGYSVRSLASIGKGLVDILVGGVGNGQKQNWLFEIKDPAQPKSKRKLTPDEQIFFDKWRGQVDIVETIEDVLKIVNP